MKKLIIALFVTCLLACTNNSKNDYKITPAENPKTSLNGILEAESRTMVADFLKDQHSSDNQTSIWFSVDFLDELLKIDKDNPGKFDGVRIHIAKRYGKNTVVLLLTTDGGPSTYAPGKQPPSKRIHTDFFSSSTTALNSIKMRNVDEYFQVPGANLYLPTPPLGGSCSNNPHHVDAATAYKWVQAFIEGQTKNKEVINLTSMWYSINLFALLKHEMDASGKNPDGFRIYFAKKENGEHAFVLVPTTPIGNGNHQDDYHCYLLTTKDVYDRGEECPTFCQGILLP